MQNSKWMATRKQSAPVLQAIVRKSCCYIKLFFVAANVTDVRAKANIIRVIRRRIQSIVFSVVPKYRTYIKAVIKVVSRQGGDICFIIIEKEL